MLSHDDVAPRKLGDTNELCEVARTRTAGPLVVKNLINQQECEQEAREIAAAAAAKEAASAQASGDFLLDPRDEELERLRAEVSQLRRSCMVASHAVRSGNAELAAAALASLDGVNGSSNPVSECASPLPCASPPPEASPTSGGSEGRLRAVLTSRTSTSSQLRQAIAAVEAMLEEARRELAAKELRERRAAFEALHAALDARSEQLLPTAIANARRTGCDEEDVAKAEAVLQDMQSLTAEQRQAKEVSELVKEKKAEAFLCVKRDHSEKLEQLLLALPEGVRWQEWRDHAQRTLWRCSQDLRAEKVKLVLAPLLGLAEDKAGKRKSRKKNPRKSSDMSEGNTPSSLGSPVSPSRGDSAPTDVSFAITPPSSPRGLQPQHHRPHASRDRLGANAVGPQVSAEDAFSHAFETVGSGWATSEATSLPGSPRSVCSPPKPGVETDEEKITKAKAFRAVANNDHESLQEVLDCTDIETMQRWLNKAGESLLVVAEKRRSNLFAMLAKAFGIAREQQRDAYEEKQAVWVYTPGEPQPRQATVLEDTPMEADTVMLIFWDGDEPAKHIDKNRVRPSWS